MTTSSGGNQTIDPQSAQELGQWVYKEAQQMISKNAGSSSGDTINSQKAEQLGKNVYQHVQQFTQSGNFPTSR